MRRELEIWFRRISINVVVDMLFLFLFVQQISSKFLISHVRGKLIWSTLYFDDNLNKYLHNNLDDIVVCCSLFLIAFLKE